MILSPAVDMLVRLKFPRFLALLVVVAGVVVGFGLLGYIVVPILSEQGNEFLARVPGVVRSVEGYLEDFAEVYPALGPQSHRCYSRGDTEGRGAV
jgi:predicted PurR-regulated permease PerM